ncbi:magnetosome protein Mad23 [Candidatus Magnetoovum chiemensis]|nr:magnetosome protein Mad23 [Candidatus Magnetoovum chiemensis]
MITKVKDYEIEIQHLISRSQEIEKEKTTPDKKTQRKFAETEVVSLIKEQKDIAVKKGEFDNDSSRAIFENILNDLLANDMEIKILAASELGKFGNTAAVPVLAETLKLENVYLTIEIINSLITLETPLSVKIFKEMAHHNNHKVRSLALRGVYKQAQEHEAIDILIDALQDKHPEVRKKAITYLGWKDNEKAAPGLIRSLQDKDENNKKAAIAALSAIKDKSSVQPLIRMILDENTEIKTKAIEAIKIITGKEIQTNVYTQNEELKTEVDKLKQWWQNEQYNNINIDFSLTDKPSQDAAEI